MPIFEYRCPQCKHKFERIVPTSETKVECSKCGHKETEKLLSSFAMGASNRGPAPMPGGGGCGRPGGT